LGRKRHWRRGNPPLGDIWPGTFATRPVDHWPIVAAARLPSAPPTLSLIYSSKSDHFSTDDVETILQLSTPERISNYVNSRLAALDNWDGTPPSLLGSFPDAPVEPEFKPSRTLSKEPLWSDFDPKRGVSLLRGFLRAITGSGERMRLDAQRRFNAAHSAWLEEKDQISNQRATHRARYDEELAKYHARKASIERELSVALETYRSQRASYLARARVEIDNIEATIIRANAADSTSIEKLTELTLFLSPYPSCMQRGVDCIYDFARRLLVLRVTVPNFELVPLLEELKTKSKPVSQARRRQYQELVVHSICLRTAYEVLRSKEFKHVSFVVVNGTMQYHDKTTGQLRSGVVASLSVSREAMEAINVHNIDAKACFRSLKGLHVPNWDHITPIPPSIDIDKNDKRIIEAEQILGALPQGTNLARIEWDDFEHLVRELFEREYTNQRPGVEVKVTRASRDWGVDAIVFDPDPLHGGRIVIQAKRYNNLVGVSSVRDLYGTVMNEGANRGILVTTSKFGPESYEFAKGKPLTLIDGANLLALFEKHGYKDFRIDLKERPIDSDL
jgi:restriction system protein